MTKCGIFQLKQTFSDWKDTSLVLAAFFWGFVVTQVFGGHYGKIYGVKWFMVISMATSSFIIVILPSIVIRFGSLGLIFGVTITGLAQGFSYSMLPVFISTWVPIREKTTLGNTIYAGTQFFSWKSSINFFTIFTSMRINF